MSFNFKHIFCWGQVVGCHFRNTNCIFSGFFCNILFCITFIFILQYCGRVYTSNHFCELLKGLSVVSLTFFFLWKCSLTIYINLHEYGTGMDSHWHSFLDTFNTYHHNHHVCYSGHQYWQPLCVISDFLAIADVVHNFGIHIVTVYLYLLSHIQLCEF